MDTYSGFEPAVGEVRALRTFRIGPGGLLYPLYGKRPWTDGPNTARCMAPPRSVPVPAHDAPGPDCSCGFYAYASEAVIAERAHTRNVLAVVACWGRVIAGTRGVRAEHCRIEAIWLSSVVPVGLSTMVAARYPSAAFYTDRAAMLADHAPTRLDCYEIEEPSAVAVTEPTIRAATVAAFVIASLPAVWLASAHLAYLIWLADLWLLVVGAALLRRARTGAVTKRRSLLVLAVVLWIAAPFAGLPGLLLLRLPMFQIVAALCLQRKLLDRAANRLPAEIG